MLLCLDKSSYDFLNVGDTCSLLNLIKGILNDLDVSQVLVHQLSLLLVGLDDLIQSSLSDHDRVGETTCLVSASVLSSLLVEVLVIKFNHPILLLEL